MHKIELADLKPEVQAVEREVYVRELRGTDLDTVAALAEIESESESLARAVVLFACDADGLPIFSDEDVAIAKALPYRLIKKVVDAGMRLNGLIGLGE